MSYALAHFSLGASISLLLFYYYTGGKTREYLAYDILVAGLGGIWAMIPDLPKLFSFLEFMFDGVLCNIFFFHCLLDELDPHDSIVVSTGLFGLFLIVILVTLTTEREI